MPRVNKRLMLLENFPTPKDRGIWLEPTLRSQS
jgi:hypothetical protein